MQRKRIMYYIFLRENKRKKTTKTDTVTTVICMLWTHTQAQMWQKLSQSNNLMHFTVNSILSNEKEFNRFKWSQMSCLNDCNANHCWLNKESFPLPISLMHMHDIVTLYIYSVIQLRRRKKYMISEMHSHCLMWKMT